MKNPATIIFTGDILLHSGYNKIASEKSPAFVFEKISGFLQEADLRVGNLETVLSNKGTPKAEKGCLRGDERYIQELRNTGFDVLSLANNHSFDFGLDAYDDMILKLQTAGIHTVGAGHNLKESRKVLNVPIEDVLLGFLAYSSRLTNGYNYATPSSPGVALLNEKHIIEDIVKYKKDVDHIIVLLHWGVEYSPYPTPDQIRIAHTIIDAGASILVGHHPRIIQGFEKYNSGFIFYSLGNFCHTDVYWQGLNKLYQSTLTSADRELMALKLKLSKAGIEDMEIIPLWLNEQGQPELSGKQTSEEILKKLGERSQILGKPDFELFWKQLIIKKRIGNPIRNWWESGNLLDKVRSFRFSQIWTLWELLSMYLQAKFSNDSSKWFLFNPANDKKPRPSCNDEDQTVS
jgi:poly-gamma-glutamate synthesis protein (capsule biosynthesis protein)